MSRTIALLLAGVTALSLTACDDSSSGAATSTTSSPTVPTLADDQPSTTSSATSSSSSATTPPPKLTDDQVQAVDATLAGMGEGSIVAALGPSTGLSDASLKPGRHTVRATCGYGTGTVTVTIIPDMDKKTQQVRTMTCAGKDFLATRDVYRGWLGSNQQVYVDHHGPGTVAVGVAFSSR